MILTVLSENGQLQKKKRNKNKYTRVVQYSLKKLVTAYSENAQWYKKALPEHFVLFVEEAHARRAPVPLWAPCLGLISCFLGLVLLITRTQKSPSPSSGTPFRFSFVFPWFSSSSRALQDTP